MTVAVAILIMALGFAFAAPLVETDRIVIGLGLMVGGAAIIVRDLMLRSRAAKSTSWCLENGRVAEEPILHDFLQLRVEREEDGDREEDVDLVDVELGGWTVFGRGPKLRGSVLLGEYVAIHGEREGELVHASSIWNRDTKSYVTVGRRRPPKPPETVERDNPAVLEGTVVEDPAPPRTERSFLAGPEPNVLFRFLGNDTQVLNVRVHRGDHDYCDVELRTKGLLPVFLRKGDTVSLRGKWRHGVLHTSSLLNRTTGTVTRGRLVLGTRLQRERTLFGLTALAILVVLLVVAFGVLAGDIIASCSPVVVR
jgi:hypothetical protein